MKDSPSTPPSVADAFTSLGLPPLIYHGTHTGHLQAILGAGIHPRGERESIWADSPSKSEHVYLSVAYGLYYALSAYSAYLCGRYGEDVEAGRLAQALTATLYKLDQAYSASELFASIAKMKAREALAAYDALHQPAEQEQPK